MSLKLDELRKRLLQEQSGSDREAPDFPIIGGGKVLGALGPKIAKAATTPQASEAPAPSKDPEASAAEPPLETKQATSAPSEAALAEPLERSSFGGDSEPEAPRDRLGTTAATAASEPAVQRELADAVGKVFEQTKAFRTRLEDLSRIFEPIDWMGNSAVRAFAPLRGFQEQMAVLARSFEPMRTFQQQLSQLAQNFEPMKTLEGQLSQLADSFQTHIGDLIKALEPAKQIGERLEQLAAAFDQATELQEQFTELYDAFQLSPSLNGSHADGLDAQSNAAR
jgi:hypothetical protein